MDSCTGHTSMQFIPRRLWTGTVICFTLFANPAVVLYFFPRVKYFCYTFDSLKVSFFILSAWVEFSTVEINFNHGFALHLRRTKSSSNKIPRDWFLCDNQTHGQSASESRARLARNITICVVTYFAIISFNKITLLNSMLMEQYNLREMDTGSFVCSTSLFSVTVVSISQSNPWSLSDEFKNERLVNKFPFIHSFIYPLQK